MPLAERAIESRDPRPLFKFLTEAMHDQLHVRYDKLDHLRDHDPADVAAARAYTSAMLSFILWAHGVHQAFGKTPHGDASATAVAAAHEH